MGEYKSPAFTGILNQFTSLHILVNMYSGMQAGTTSTYILHRHTAIFIPVHFLSFQNNTKTVFYLKSTFLVTRFPKEPAKDREVRKRPQKPGDERRKTSLIRVFLFCGFCAFVSVFLRSFANFAFFCGLLRSFRSNSLSVILTDI